MQNDGDRLRRRVLELNRTAARWFYDQLQQPQGAAVQAYLDKRQIRRSVAVRFGMGASLDQWDALLRAMSEKGFTKKELMAAGLAVAGRGGRIYDKFRNRLMLPVIDVRGDVVGFGSRVIDNSEPKYMNTTDTPTYSKRRVLYGLNLAKKTKRPNIILCEGNLDVVTLHQAGFDNAVASMGTALTTEQTRLLSRFTKELVLCYDNDNAGKAATEKALQLLNNSEFTVRVLQLPRRRTEDGELVKQDPDDYLKYHGAEAFERLLSGSENGIEFRMAQVAGKYDLSRDEDRVAYAEDVSALLSTLGNAAEREICTARAAEAAHISAEAMKLEVQRAMKRRSAQERKARQRRDLNPAAALQPAERSLRYENLRSARAEEGILQLLTLDAGLFPAEPPVREEQFSSPLLGKAFRLLWQQRQAGRTPQVAALAGDLEPREMDVISGICQRPQSMATAPQALADYIRIIQEEYQKRSGRGEEDPLRAAMEKYRKSGNGGKQA